MLDVLTKILLAEDAPSIRLSMSAILSETGYTLSTAEDGFSALREIRLGMPDILLSDLYMPGMTGFELLSVVRLRFPSIRTIAMSGAFDDNLGPAGIAADAFYAKGCGVGPLLQTLHTMSQTERHNSRASSATSPLWIYSKVSASSSTANITIPCLECLRTSSHALQGSADLVQITECTYCHWPIHFAIAKSFDRPQLEHPSTLSLPHLSRSLSQSPSTSTEP